tara:strand:- start:119 stop:361 length:243 start_codon:yes stop_codon:yes gene_type:complete
MDKSYIKSEERATKIGLWVLFFNILMIFIWLVYKLYESFHSEPNYSWETSFNNVGIPIGLIFVGLLLFAITRRLMKGNFS